MAERGDLVSQIVNGESEDDIEEDTNSEVELLETSNSDRRGDLSNKYPGDNAGDLDSTPVPRTPSSSSSSTISDSSTTAKSLMDSLRTPTASELSRKRKIDCNKPPKGKKRSRGTCSSDPKFITPEQRVKQHPKECFSVSNKKLFCLACREELSVKSSVVIGHIKSVKHLTGKSRLESQKKKDLEIVEALRSNDAMHNPKGETLPDNQRVYRVKVTRTFLSAGVPLNKIPIFRSLLEEIGFRLTDRRRMSDIVPLILQQEKEKIRNEISGKCLSVIFDGTSRLGEVFVIVIRFVDSGWLVHQRLIRVKLLANSLSGEEIAREIINSLSLEYGVGSEHVLAVMHDCASTNVVAMRTLKVLYPLAQGIGCFSHTLDHVGERFSTPIAHEFVTYWISLFAHSPKARLLWSQQTGRTVQGYSATRWWSKWEVLNQLFELFGDVKPFLNHKEEFSSSTRAKLAEYFADNQKLNALKVELAAIIDAGKPFVQATYKLEGDGLLVFQCYEIISALSTSVILENYPNVQAVVKSIAKGKTDVQLKWMKHARLCIQPALDYYQEHLQASIMSVPLRAFKAARVFDPHFLNKTKPEHIVLNTLSAFSFITEPVLLNLKQEFPLYVAAVEDISGDLDAILFWKQYANNIPTWKETTAKVLLLQPSSAAAERVFSILKNSFGDQQLRSLEDYLETSLIVQHNDKSE